MLAATMPSPAHGVDHYENFPVASLLCPPHLRPAVKAIYHFARTADDLADEGQASAAQRLAELDQFEADLAACATAQTPSSGRWPAVFDPLAPVLRDWKLPLDLLRDLLSAFKQDVTQSSYANPAQLLDYCRRSANPVGRLLLHLYQIRDETSLRKRSLNLLARRNAVQSVTTNWKSALRAARPNVGCAVTNGLMS